MTNVVSIASKVSIRLEKESWNMLTQSKRPFEWTEKEYVAAYMRLNSKYINN
jgi:hypothetical protein